MSNNESIPQTRPRSNTRDITPPEAVDTKDEELPKAEMVFERAVEGKVEEQPAQRMSLGETHAPGTRSRSGSLADRVAAAAEALKEVIVEGKDLVVEKASGIINRLRSDSLERAEATDLALSQHHTAAPSHLILYFTTLHNISPEKQHEIIEREARKNRS
eukprot:TRINITY_DN1973_c0_g1_i1.p1 TRINITY_DN1973_c0_g1~~TRINITY_DN1973_c0_g1_i1.p1  ORF type:complete len:160 (-),score=29.02 TRINITY_DN1973_c0_g1_i1:570-1049(-)